MIVKTAAGDRFAADPPRQLVAALFFGPDQGLVHERADALARNVCADLRDPFRVAELDDAALSKDPARLADEARALSLTGGRRVLRVRTTGNGLAKLFAGFLASPLGDALIVVEGGDLARDSALKAAFADSEQAAAVECYPDSQETLSELLRKTLTADGIALSDEALDLALSLLGADRAMARGQIEKLALYARGTARVEAAEVRAVLGDEAEARAEEACDAAGEGDWRKLDRALERLWADHVTPVAVLRIAISHFQRLLQVKTGQNIEAVMKRWPQVHFSRAASFRGQAARWNTEHLQSILDLLLDTEALCKTTAVPAEAACGRALFNVAAMAKQR